MDDDIAIIHKLGFMRGTSIWLEEVVNKFFFSTIQSFVYFGAAILLVLLAINKFYDADPIIVVYGICIEVAILLFVFFIMLFSPSVEAANLIEEQNQGKEIGEELLEDIGEISKDFAITSAQLDKISDHILNVTNQQDEILKSIQNIIHNILQISNPNPALIDIMKQTNINLVEFNTQISNLINSFEKIQYQQIQAVVKNELESYFTDKINNNIKDTIDSVS